ncbi:MULTISPECIES: hypothetical protein, partial [unclassified Corynebacterium]|uniref:hypothetical protein n=1 Tax=unclassified Corynebacterium TaxID=2624378 RepID=UPI001AEF7091
LQGPQGPKGPQGARGPAGPDHTPTVEVLARSGGSLNVPTLVVSRYGRLRVLDFLSVRAGSNYSLPVKLATKDRPRAQVQISVVSGKKVTIKPDGSIVYDAKSSGVDGQAVYFV